MRELWTLAYGEGGLRLIGHVAWLSVVYMSQTHSLSRFFCQRYSKEGAHDDEHEKTPQSTSLRQLIAENRADCVGICDTVGLIHRAVGSAIK